jgi:hypothetical protein
LNFPLKKPAGIFGLVQKKKKAVSCFFVLFFSFNYPKHINRKKNEEKLYEVISDPVHFEQFFFAYYEKKNGPRSFCGKYFCANFTLKNPHTKLPVTDTSMCKTGEKCTRTLMSLHIYVSVTACMSEIELSSSRESLLFYIRQVVLLLENIVFFFEIIFAFLLHLRSIELLIIILAEFLTIFVTQPFLQKPCSSPYASRNLI